MKKLWRLFLLFYWGSGLSVPDCPSLYKRVFQGSVPAGKLLNDFDKVESAQKLEDCVDACCEDASCNEAFFFEKNETYNCFKAKCEDDLKCLPSEAGKANNSTFVVLVRPSGSKPWAEILTPSLIKNSHPFIRPLPCRVGSKPCPENQVCSSIDEKTPGKCQCKDGYYRSSEGSCSPSAAPETTPREPSPLTVEISSKNITLPESSATLTAFAIPEAPPDNPYEYEWKLISNQTLGIMKNANTRTLMLSNLAVGTYQFKVIVKGNSIIGDALGNITVLPPKRINQPPKAKVHPTNRTIYLPTNTAIVGSDSEDDMALKLTYKWEILVGPMGYSPTLPSEPTLTLNNLIVGNYTIKLTVTDSDGVSDSATSLLTVLPERDYPPTANAGGDIIIFLPKNEAVLNGNRSTDDHGIKDWEWIRLQSGSEVAIGMENVRKPQLKITNLVKGDYSFSLKVTDTKGQTSEDQVTVYVHDPVNAPPTANAGKDQEILLPTKWITLDGSQSKDDINVTFYEWSQVSGPEVSKILNPLTAVTNVTNLTKGVYQFKLFIQDNDKNNASDTVTVTVNQDTNLAPTANAGEDVTLYLPQLVIPINGSKSEDDLRIARWKWERDQNSLAAGKIIGNSSCEPVLYLTDVVPGEYTFKLTVWDDQGKSSTDSVSISIKDNPQKMNVLQIILDENIESLVANRLNRILEQIKLLIGRGDDATINVELISLFPQLDSNFAVIHFLVKKESKDGKKNEVVKGKDVLKVLKSKLRADSDLLELKVLELDTLVCQNTCSGHGKCLQATRMCVCDPFWIENFVRRQLMDGKSNCEWSIIYVGIFLTIFMVMISCGIVFIMCKKKKIRVAPKRRYTRLGQRDQDIELQSNYTSSLVDSDESESDDEEILFENASNGLVVGNGGGFMKSMSRS